MTKKVKIICNKHSAITRITILAFIFLFYFTAYTHLRDFYKTVITLCKL